MNIIYIFKIQDGERQRKEYQYETLPDTATKEDINAKGEELNRENFSGEQLSGDFYWDRWGEIAGSYYTHKIIPCDESFRVIQEILIC